METYNNLNRNRNKINMKNKHNITNSNFNQVEAS